MKELLGNRIVIMVLSTSPFISLGFALALMMAPLNTMAKQKLDQPALFPANALKSAATVNHYAPDYVSVDNQGRMFVEIPNHDRDSGPSLAILNPNDSMTPYPGGSWNEWNSPHPSTKPLNPEKSFIGLTGMTLTPDGCLWLLDSGIEKTGTAPVKNGIKIIRINTGSNQVIQTYPVPASVILPGSVFNALAIHDHYAYFADRNRPSIIVMDLNTGKARRLLENSSSLHSRRSITINHHMLRPNSDEDSSFNVNQLAIAPDGKRLYYQAVSGPLYRIDTMYLNDPTYSESELDEAMILWFDTPTSGGITCDTDGNLYFTDLSTNSIYRFSTGRILNKLVTDPRLQWPAHPFITQDKTLYVPTLQVNPDYHSASVQWPLSIYRLSLTPLQ